MLYSDYIGFWGAWSKKLNIRWFGLGNITTYWYCSVFLPRFFVNNFIWLETNPAKEVSNHMGIADLTSTNRNNRIICLPFSQDNYERNIHNADDFKICIDKRIELFPELFPAQIVHGYRMKDIYRSKKQSIWIRRIAIAGVAYTIRPSFIMPYLVGYVDEIQAALFLRKFNVPFWAASYVFCKTPCIGSIVSSYP